MTGASADTWLFTSWSNVEWIMLSALLMLAVVVVTIRVVGLRSMSKMSSIDFAVTVAIGSIIGPQVLRRWPARPGPGLIRSGVQLRY